MKLYKNLLLLLKRSSLDRIDIFGLKFVYLAADLYTVAWWGNFRLFDVQSEEIIYL